MGIKKLISRLGVFMHEEMCTISIGNITFKSPLHTAVCLSAKIFEVYSTDSTIREFSFKCKYDFTSLLEDITNFFLNGEVINKNDMEVLKQLYFLGKELGIEELCKIYTKKLKKIPLSANTILLEFEFRKTSKNYNSLCEFIIQNIDKFNKDDLISFFIRFGYDITENILFNKKK